MKKSLLITNIPSHYREEIFQKLSNLEVDFLFSNKRTTIASLNISSLKSNVYAGKLIELCGLNYLLSSIRVSSGYDFIIITGDFKSIHAWLMLYLSFFRNQKVILWGHSWYGREGWLKKIVKKAFFFPSYRILTYGNYAKSLMVREGVKRNKIIPIYNSLSYEKHLILRNEILSKPNTLDVFDNGNLTLLFLGRVTRVKKLPLVLEAIEKLEKRGVLVNLLVIGPEVDNGALRKNVDRSSISERVKFLGPLYDESEICRYVYSSAVCVSPGNVGLTAIHCLSFGTPVITHSDLKNQMPESEAIIPWKTGVFFKKDSVEDLANQLEDFLPFVSKNREKIRNSCFEEVDRVWNTRYQMKVFNELLQDKYG